MPVTESPLRYPGGKTKMYPLVRDILNNNLEREERIYVEPYAGGAGLALKLLFQKDVDYLILNDLDYHIFCFWNSCLKDADRFCGKIADIKIDLEEWEIQKDIYNRAEGYSQLDIAVATFYLNRCNVSGIIKGGPIGGMKQLGKYTIDARFNRSSLIKRIERIASCKNSIRLFNLDAVDFLDKVVKKLNTDNVLLNIDPPYVKKGSLLYQNSYCEEDHKRIAEAVKTIQKRWIVTYDKCELIEQLYRNYHMETIRLNYSTGQFKTGEEYLIYSDRIAHSGQYEVTSHL